MAKEKNKVITTLYLPEKLMIELKVYAARAQKSMSDIMEKSLTEYMNNNK